ncbi:Putative maltose transporter MalT [Fulvivirga imtechensis AK7]|uniref:Putative maltose transporter MalT n=1 Tax=Fulvivirga imtechensis AK7 TaxID=1237149 RepID=L8JZB3_9BACT|nr:MFS transporter [Fulvivirga imtechensis]ELR73498.1 Putative maltose transporter MalT [Fulvivirga imtechensis AK7]
MEKVSLSSEKPRLSFWQIWNMSFGFLGIQFGFALQNANTSRIFETLGGDTKNLAFYWLAAPVTGLLVQPIIGYYSDRTWHPKWGRRRPFFAIGAILASIALIIMPNSPALWIAIGTLWIMDASINISMEPFRAFVGDMLPPSQRTTGFAMQSFFIGVGAVVASALPWIFANIFGITDDVLAEGQIPTNVKWSFYVGALAFFTAVMWTVFSTKEYPPDEEEHHESHKDQPIVIRYSPNTYMTIGLVLLAICAALIIWFYTQDLEPQLYVLCGVLALFGFAYFLASLFMKKNRYRNGFVQIVRDFQNMPKTMIQLAFVQFFSWFALFAMWIYTTSAVTSHIYLSTDTTSLAYNDGADWVSLLFSGYNGVAAIAALLLPYLARYTSRRMTHLIALSCGGAGLISFYFITDPNWLILSMVGVGIAWASILSIPYAMLSSSLPAQKMGYYMGIFNFFIVIPQIVAASILGFLVSTFFNSEFIYALIIGGGSMIFAGLLCLIVKDKDEVLMKENAA